MPLPATPTGNMSQVLIIIVISYGALLNLLAKPWSSTESLLERRRNDIVAIFLWSVLMVIAAQTIRSGISSTGTSNAFDLQDWTALVLPFALAAPYLLELSATLVRQLEMWRWMRRATIEALPIAWCYRTMTVGEADVDGSWLERRHWAPWSRHSEKAPFFSSEHGFWKCTSRKATLFFLFRRWLVVLSSAVLFSVSRCNASWRRRKVVPLLQHGVIVLFISILCCLTLFLLAFCAVEYLLLLCFDYAWWKKCQAEQIIVARYDTVHFGRQEMQSIFEYSLELRQQLSCEEEAVDLSNVHNRIMGAVITTTAVLENAFRCAYLVVPVYEVMLSNRKALREKYMFVNCDLDRLIKQIRVLLEIRHTAGLLSIKSSSGTIEAALHDNIESILSIALYYNSGVLYNITSCMATIERKIEARIESSDISPETRLRERVTYIDTRNAVFWLLWVYIVRDWDDPRSVWMYAPTDKMTKEGSERIRREFPERRIQIVYIIAAFLARCRYASRFGIGDDMENACFIEVKEIAAKIPKSEVHSEFDGISKILQHYRGFTLLDWTEMEYGIKWDTKDLLAGPLWCQWKNDAGAELRSKCEIAICSPETTTVGSIAETQCSFVQIE